MTQSGTDSWDVAEDAFPAAGGPHDQLRFALRYAVLAPSAHNTQPWLFRVKQDAVELYADRTRALPVSDPEDRELLISCGAALFNLRVALRRFGWRGEVTLHPEPDDPDLLARVRPGASGEASAEEIALFRAIRRRRTNRRKFDARAVPEPLVRVRTGVTQVTAMAPIDATLKNLSDRFRQWPPASVVFQTPP